MAKMTDIALARAAAMALPAAEPDQKIGYGFDVVIEPNSAAKERIAREIEAAKSAGIIPPEGFELAPHEQDLVVYRVFTVTTKTTPGGLAIPGGQLAQARIRREEFDRAPLLEIRERADGQFRSMFGG